MDDEVSKDDIKAVIESEIQYMPRGRESKFHECSDMLWEGHKSACRRIADELEVELRKRPE